jgi:hypothetical protein
MQDPPREDLVVLDPGTAGQTLAQLRKIANVTQVLAPRLVLVRAEPALRARIAGVAGVLGVYSDVPPELADLAPAERVFISAWQTRGAPKQRAGDGLSWDAPGFMPPDAPDDKDE